MGGLGRRLPLVENADPDVGALESDFLTMVIARTCEPEVMDTQQEAADYDSMDHSTVNQLFVDELIAFVEEHRSVDSSFEGRIVDLGTGTAQIPLRLVDTWSAELSVVATDLSHEMLKVAQRNIVEANQSASILAVFCDAKQLPIPDRSVQILISNSIVHHIPEPADVFREMARIVSDGGILFVRDLLRPDTVDAVEGLVATYAGQENEHQQSMFRESLHAALTIDEVRELLKSVGLNPAWATVTSDRHWTIAGRVEGLNG